ncbi:sulfurtransferase complex subunit TusB [Pseudomonas sp. R5(2019)]|uniref:sulfurtransferase complex subunit TusB n=1 Tax=Pseudomonas sp. R5(2019) TaxID=2697566 RepID=UPI0014124293|nr:sulfurtransferase complex subunit TusB [Pseudomonas sp. R5(2019)]NBA96805.1 sulfurtransferase complex subunit TusB [Pseudomonas sp. R5(2019)]
MTTLHVLSHSPFGDNRLDSCLRLLGNADAILLTGDAVYALQPGSEPQRKLNHLGARLFALQEDLQARNISSDAQQIDYPGFVELSIRFDKVNSWL